MKNDVEKHGLTDNIYGLISFKLANFVNSNERSAQLLMMRNHDITLIEFRIIGLIDAHQKIAASQIQKVLTLDKGQLSRTIKKLKSKLLVETQPDPEDQRSSMLVLTTQGRAKFAELFPIVAQRNDHILTDLNASEITQLFSLLDRMKPYIDERLAFEEQASDHSISKK